MGHKVATIFMGNMKDFFVEVVNIVGKFRSLHLTPFSSYPIFWLSSFCHFEIVKELRTEEKRHGHL